jgi:PAS domain S-box-containing protein
MKKNSSLGRLFVLAFTFFLIVPLMAVFVFFLATIYNSNKTEIAKDLQAVCHAISGKLNSRLESHAMYISAIADALNAGSSERNIDQMMVSGINNFRIFNSIYVLDNDKKIRKIYFSGFSRYNKHDFLDIKLSDVNNKDMESFSWSRPFSSLVTNSHVVRVSRKYTDGYVVGDLNLKFLTDSLTYTNIADSVSLFIVDSRGDVIANDRGEITIDNLFNHPAVVESYLGGHITFDYKRGDDTYTAAGFKIPVADWYLILEQNQFVAFNLFYDILYVTVVSAVVVVLFISAMLYLLNVRFISPIRRLTDRTKNISDSTDLIFARPEVTVFSELKDLYDSFEKMSERLVSREKELRNKEEYVRSIFDSTTNTGIIVISNDPEPVIKDANVGAQLISGYKMSELLGLPPAALVRWVGDDIGRMKREAVSKNAMVTARFEMTKKNGISFPVLCTVHPLLDESGSTDSLIVVFIDITELTRAQQALESEKERLDVTLKSIGEGVIATDRAGRITLVNASTENILGQKYRYLIGHNICDVLQIYDHNTGDDLSDDLLRCEDISKRIFVANVISNDAGVIVVSVTASQMLNTKGDTVGAVYVFRDISEQIKMENELINRKQQLEEINRNLEIRVLEETERRRKNEQMLFEQSKFAAMGQMISAIAHQWRQPLNALALYTQDIEDAYEMEEVNAAYLRSFVENSMSLINHMSATIDDFRNFFHSTNAKEECNYVDVIFQSVGLVSTQLRNQNIDFEIIIRNQSGEHRFTNTLPALGVKYGKNLLLIPSEIKQVVLNILQNARDAIAEKRRIAVKETGHIRILIEYLEDGVVTTLSNDGGNIPEDSLMRIFDPYFTTKPEGEGTGIGLYMSRIMIEEHMGGKVMAENTDAGASFVIRLYY